MICGHEPRVRTSGSGGGSLALAVLMHDDLNAGADLHRKGQPLAGARGSHRFDAGR
jgi:hypothetical protein